MDNPGGIISPLKRGIISHQKKQLATGARGTPEN